MKTKKLIWRFLKANFQAPSSLIKLNFVLTYQCNSRCSMCNIWKKGKTGKELTIGEIEQFFSKSNEFSWIDLSGGEIFLRDDLQDVAKIIISKCEDLFLFHFATNGLLTDRVVTFVGWLLKSQNVPKVLVTVSVDGYESLHDKIRGVPGGFKKTIATFAALRKFNSKKFKVFLGMTIGKDNFSGLNKTIDAVKELIPDFNHTELHVNILQESEHYYDNKTGSNGDQRYLFDVIKKIRDQRPRKRLSPVAFLEDKYLKLSKKFLQDHHCPLPCKSGVVSCFIDPSGDVYPCVAFSKLIGNIRDYGYELKKLLASSRAQDIIRDIRRGDCPHCWTPCEAYQTIMANILRVF